MAVRVYRRYLKLEPTRVEEYVDYLITIDRRDEAATRLAEALNNEKCVPFSMRRWVASFQIETIFFNSLPGSSRFRERLIINSGWS